MPFPLLFRSSFVERWSSPVHYQSCDRKSDYCLQPPKRPEHGKCRGCIAKDHSCLQLHLPGIIRIDPHYTSVVLFTVWLGLEGAVELATLQRRKLGLQQVERGGWPLPLHIGLGRGGQVSLEARHKCSPYKWSHTANATYELASSVKAESKIQLGTSRTVLFFMAQELKRILVKTALRIPT